MHLIIVLRLLIREHEVESHLVDLLWVAAGGAGVGAEDVPEGDILLARLPLDEGERPRQQRRQRRRLNERLPRPRQLEQPRHHVV